MGDRRSKGDYQNAVVTAVACAQVLAQHDIEGLLGDIETADAVGPLLDPTLWGKNRNAMAEDREVLEAAAKLARIGKMLAERKGGA